MEKAPGPPFTITTEIGCVEVQEPLVALVPEMVTTDSLPAGFSKMLDPPVNSNFAISSVPSGHSKVGVPAVVCTRPTTRSTTPTTATTMPVCHMRMLRWMRETIDGIRASQKGQRQMTREVVSRYVARIRRRGLGALAARCVPARRYRIVPTAAVGPKVPRCHP